MKRVRPRVGRAFPAIAHLNAPVPSFLVWPFACRRRANATIVMLNFVQFAR